MKYPYDASYQPPFPVVRVVFHNNEVGRNVLNKLRLFLDGPANLTEIPSQ